MSTYQLPYIPTVPQPPPLLGENHSKTSAKNVDVPKPLLPISSVIFSSWAPRSRRYLLADVFEMARQFFPSFQPQFRCPRPPQIGSFPRLPCPFRGNRLGAAARGIQPHRMSYLGAPFDVVPSPTPSRLGTSTMLSVNASVYIRLSMPPLGTPRWTHLQLLPSSFLHFDRWGFGIHWPKPDKVIPMQNSPFVVRLHEMVPSKHKNTRHP